MTSTARAVLDAAMSEEALAAIFEDILLRNCWNWFHPYSGERAGTILDYLCWRERLAFVELKTEHGKLSVDRMARGRDGRLHSVKGQVTVIAELRAARQEVHVIRPSNLDEAERIFGRA